MKQLGVDEYKIKYIKSKFYIYIDIIQSGSYVYVIVLFLVGNVCRLQKDITSL